MPLPVPHRCIPTIGVSLVCYAAVAGAMSVAAAQSINRKALVSRNSPHLNRMDVDCPFTVGNGGFAFGADITGLQTFDSLYHREGVPTETLSRWCWVTDPNPQGFTLADACKPYLQGNGVTLPYPTEANTPAGDWLRRNPRSQPLGRLRFTLIQPGGRSIEPDDIGSPEQSLDLWSGVLTSRFRLDNQSVEVTTACHPDEDTLGVVVNSPLLKSGRFRIELAFPRGHDPNIKNTPALDWSQPDSHQSKLLNQSQNHAEWLRSVASTNYHVALSWSGKANLAAAALPHTFELIPSPECGQLSLSLRFSPNHNPSPLPSTDAIRAASSAAWQNHWLHGGMIDFSGSSDPRAATLERRIILSQYLTACQLAGDVPPQESGLTCNTWYGKHHSEMILWHCAHFALWGRDDKLAKNLEWFRKNLPQARQLAASRGLRGARWAKMTGPEARESPGGNPLIIWNQPHLIFLCELLYRNHPNHHSLQHWKDLVIESAECMASMAWLDSTNQTRHLGPPLWIAQELFDPATSRDPAFELSYWRWALETAQQWLVRLGEPRNPTWDEVIRQLPPIPVKNNLYVALASHPNTFDDAACRHDHPTMLAPLGLLPGRDVDQPTMNRTLSAVLSSWDWETKIWGWDYPMIAMTATRLGRPEDAVDVLLREAPNNRYLPNGHCPQRSDVAMPGGTFPNGRKREIAVYLPANGSLLTAVALMAAGWDHSATPLPGFPKNNRWSVRFEDLKPMP